MSEAADYFKRERYITRRLSLVVLGGAAFLVLATFAVAHERMVSSALWWAVGVVTLGVVAAVILIVRAANAKFPRSATPDNLPLDNVTRRKLRRRVLFLEIFAVVYALMLLSILFHAHRGEWPGVLGACAIIVLMESALIKAARRLKRKLKEGTAAVSSTSVE
jgi:FtsH-binding integral membrane protein